MDLARWTAKAGDPAAARDQFAEIADIEERKYGPESLLTLNARSELAGWTGQAGDPAAARDQYAEIADIRERKYGTESLATLNARSELAHWTGQAGDPAAARDQYVILVPIFERVAPAFNGTVDARASMAYYTGLADDWATARDLYAELLPVWNQAWPPGREHPDQQGQPGLLHGQGGRPRGSSGRVRHVAAHLGTRVRARACGDAALPGEPGGLQRAGEQGPASPVTRGLLLKAGIASIANPESLESSLIASLVPPCACCFIASRRGGAEIRILCRQRRRRVRARSARGSGYSS